MVQLQQAQVLVAILGVWVLGTLVSRADFRQKRSVNVHVPGTKEPMKFVVGPTTCIRHEPGSKLVGMQVPPPLSAARAPSQRSWVKVLAVRDGWWKTAYLTEGQVHKGSYVVVMYATDGVQQRIPQSECLVSHYRQADEDKKFDGGGASHGKRPSSGVPGNAAKRQCNKGRSGREGASGAPDDDAASPGFHHSNPKNRLHLGHELTTYYAKSNPSVAVKADVACNARGTVKRGPGGQSRAPRAHRETTTHPMSPFWTNWTRPWPG